MSKIDYINPGEIPTGREFNRLIDTVESLLGSTSTQYFRDSRGVHTARTQTLGEPVRRAFVRITPGATTNVEVYLDKDNSSVEVTVACYIYGGGNLDGAFPTLVDGMPLYVQFDRWKNKWKNVTSIYKIGTGCGA